MPDPAIEHQFSRPEYQIFAHPQQREIIKRRAVDMLEAAKDVDTVVFLDRTARPLTQLLIDLWPVMFPDKRRPNIRVLNIGSEKVSVLRKYALDTEYWIPGTPSKSTRELAPLVSRRQDLEQIYGVENIEGLLRILKSSRPEKRLIVDEICNTGDTRLLSERIITVADNKNQYSSFTLIESPSDRQLFYDGWDTAQAPWFSSIPPVEDVKQSMKSFRVRTRPDLPLREKGLRVIREFKLLAKEITEELQIGNLRQNR